MNKNEELSIINKKIAKTQRAGTPGALLLGFGLYGLFSADGDAFHPLLNNQLFVASILVVGAAIEICQFCVLILCSGNSHNSTKKAYNNPLKNVRS